ncbi:MAG TPA: precorrin-2 C(20)-methyltransferase [Polyangiaceae bacterium]|nr:precorrin-2 C(20)-methyltransferase [Polyangiaceae bacterium]
MTYGTLYGVGVGPGAPDLLTLRAVETLKRADVLALPRSSDYGASMAWKIIKPVIGERAGQERLFLTFPMSKDPDRLRPAWDLALAAIGERLRGGASVAFVTEGDASLYSTFIYLRREAPQRWPGVRIEIVPGVSSIAAVPAVTGIPIADGQECVAIVPANYGAADLSRIFATFDTTILMKIGSEMPRVIEALERAGLADKAVYVSKATMAEERIVRDVRDVRDEHGDCFAMIIVAKKERSGVLVGDVPFAERALAPELGT